MFDDRVGALLCIGDRVDAELRRIPRWPYVRDVAVGKVEPETVDGVDVHDGVEAQFGRKIVGELLSDRAEIAGSVAGNDREAGLTGKIIDETRLAEAGRKLRKKRAVSRMRSFR